LDFDRGVESPIIVAADEFVEDGLPLGSCEGSGVGEGNDGVEFLGVDFEWPG